MDFTDGSNSALLAVASGSLTALWRHQRHDAMTSVQIKDVPEETHAAVTVVREPRQST